MSSQFNFDNFDISVFNQGRFWINADGLEVEIVEMSDRYISNLIEFLELNVSDFYLSYLHVINNKLRVRDESFLIQEEINHSFTGKQSWDSTPIEWLGSTSLYRALLLEMRER